jgi:hypothetical protein
VKPALSPFCRFLRKLLLEGDDFLQGIGVMLQLAFEIGVALFEPCDVPVLQRSHILPLVDTILRRIEVRDRSRRRVARGGAESSDIDQPVSLCRLKGSASISVQISATPGINVQPTAVVNC